MIRLLFTHGQEILIFDINEKTIIYRDRKWPRGIQFIPKDPNLIKMILYSRNRIGHQLITWVQEANSGKNLEEWQSCKDDQEVAEKIKRDAAIRGCVFRKKFTDEELNNPDNFDKAMVNKIPVQNNNQEEEN